MTTEREERLREALRHARVFIQDAHDWMHTTEVRPLPEFLMATATYKAEVDAALASAPLASGKEQKLKPRVDTGNVSYGQSAKQEPKP